MTKLINVSVPCWGKAINTYQIGKLKRELASYTFPSPVGVRPLTQKSI